MTKCHEITIPYPVWETLLRVEEIVSFLKKCFVVSGDFPKPIPRNVKVKELVPEADECDRLHLTLWMSGSYIYVVTAGYKDEKGSFWQVKSISMKWSEMGEDGEKIKKEFTPSNEATELLSRVAEGRTDLLPELIGLIGEYPFKTVT